MKLAVVRYIVPLLFLISTSSTAHAGAPTDQIQSTVQDVLSTLKAALNPQAEEKRLRKIIADRFNFAETPHLTRRSFRIFALCRFHARPHPN
jgi:hypothetical protein